MQDTLGVKYGAFYFVMLGNKTICAAPGPAVFACPVCGDFLSSQDNLDKHVLDSHPQRPQGRLQCSYCPYTSSRCSDVTKHERTHTGERPFVCQLCRKGFAQRGGLRTHLREVHAKERPHKCEVCGQGFTRTSHLAQHRRVMHTREGPSFACPQCGKGFTQKSNLNTHLLTHTGERPHACATCGMRFTQLRHMRSHEMVVHDRQYLHCPHCGKGLYSVHKLRQHLRAWHQGDGGIADGEGKE